MDMINSILKERNIFFKDKSKQYAQKSLHKTILVSDTHGVRREDMTRIPFPVVVNELFYEFMRDFGYTIKISHSKNSASVYPVIYKNGVHMPIIAARTAVYAFMNNKRVNASECLLKNSQPLDIRIENIFVKPSGMVMKQGVFPRARQIENAEHGVEQSGGRAHKNEIATLLNYLASKVERLSYRLNIIEDEITRPCKKDDE